MLVVTLDQRQSRRGPNRAAPLAERLNSEPGIATLLPFELTVGDELQGVLATPASLPGVVRVSLSDGNWWIGVGIGAADPLGATARVSTGSAFVLARAAVSRAKKTPWGIAVEPDDHDASLLDSALALWVTLLRLRSDRGWEAVALRYRGLSETEVAEALGITQQAVNQRLRSAHYAQDIEGGHLVEALARSALDRLDAS